VSTPTAGTDLAVTPSRGRQRSLSLLLLGLGLFVAVGGLAFASTTVHTGVRGDVDTSIAANGHLDYRARCGVPLFFWSVGSPYKESPPDLQFTMCAPKLESRRNQGLLLLLGGVILGSPGQGLRVSGNRWSQRVSGNRWSQRDSDSR
jgi:hypothetical protein